MHGRPSGPSAVAMGRSWRPDPGTALVLLNSIGADDDAWRFSGIEGTVRFSYPGHGTRARRSGWTHEDMADEVVESVEGPIDLVGMALGGLIALQVLVRHPERVRSAVLVCGGDVRGTQERAELVRNAATRRGRAALEGGMSAVVDDTLRRWFTPFAVRTDHLGVAYARKTLSGMDPEAWNDIWLSLANSALVSEQEATRIEQPVTIVGGMHDRSTGLDGRARLHRLIPNSRFEIVAGPHMMHLEQPENLRTAVERHFAWSTAGNRVERPISSPGWPSRSAAQAQGCA
jgi:pimeloyl-ACP methyl ester carboxylesterase